MQLASKGGGSENKTKFAMLNPSDSLVDWVLKTVPHDGRRLVPPGMLGIGVGGTAEKAMLMAKQSLDGRYRHVRAAGSAARRTSWKSCASSCTRRSTRWASARRAWAG